MNDVDYGSPEFRNKIKHAIHTGQFQFGLKMKAAERRDAETYDLVNQQHAWMHALMEKLPLKIQIAESEGRKSMTILAYEFPYKLTAVKVEELYQKHYYVNGVQMNTVLGNRSALYITWPGFEEDDK